MEEKIENTQPSKRARLEQSCIIHCTSEGATPDNTNLVSLQDQALGYVAKSSTYSQSPADFEHC